MRKIILSEETLTQCIKDAIYEFFKRPVKYYDITKTDDIAEYMWLEKTQTGLNVDIFVDDGGAYKRHKHPLALLVRNSYTGNNFDTIPVSVSSVPHIMLRPGQYEVNISSADIKDVYRFILKNLKLLTKLAKREIKQIDFLTEIIPLDEEVRAINEMSTIRKEDTKLPTDIWLDEVGTYRGHAPRIKFKANKEQRNSMEFSSMTITDEPTIENLPNRCSLKNKDLEKLKKFVINNKELLISLYNRQITLEIFMKNANFN